MPGSFTQLLPTLQFAAMPDIPMAVKGLQSLARQSLQLLQPALASNSPIPEQHENTPICASTSVQCSLAEDITKFHDSLGQLETLVTTITDKDTIQTVKQVKRLEDDVEGLRGRVNILELHLVDVMLGLSRQELPDYVEHRKDKPLLTRRQHSADRASLYSAATAVTNMGSFVGPIIASPESICVSLKGIQPCKEGVLGLGICESPIEERGAFPPKFEEPQETYHLDTLEFEVRGPCDGFSAPNGLIREWTLPMDEDGAPKWTSFPDEDWEPEITEAEREFVSVAGCVQVLQ